MEYRYHGIILSKKDVAETDRIYSIYTLESGKIRVLGKGARNPNAKLAGSLEPATYSEIYVSRTRGMGKITGAIVLENYSQIKSDWEKMNGIFQSFFLTEKIITNEEKDEAAFGLLLAYLQMTEDISTENRSRLEIMNLGFIFKLFQLAGYGLNMENCTGCGKKLLPQNNFFSAQHGGIFCGDCAHNGAKKIIIKSGAIKMIRIFLSNKIENFLKINASGEDMKNTKIVAQEMERWITN